MSAALSVTFHGAGRTVTGSCMQFSLGGKSVLVDCGMFQGSRSLEVLNARPFAFDARSIDAVVLTHAHIDHSGLLPKLVAAGFEGDIWCTDPTADLLEYMLADAGRIQEADTDRRNRRRDRAGEAPFEPVYTEADAMQAWQQARAVALEEWFEPAPGFRARLWNAGHILGSASVELEAGGARLICSGDIGPDNKAFHADPAGPNGFDFVICESTYGDRTRERLTMTQRRAELATVIEEAIARGGNLVIPAFALERTQELLLDIAMLCRAGTIRHIPVFVDSPLANRATQVFADHIDELEDIGGENVFEHPAIHPVRDVAESIRLNSVSGAIIIAASGMCESGRIRHHLLHNLSRRDSTVLFVGFQAAGSLGRVLMDGAQRVRISGQDVHVRAQIRRIDHYSAHADQGELLDWIAERAPISGSLFLTHGEPAGQEALAALVAQRLPGVAIRLPEIGEAYSLSPGKPARRTATGRADARAATGSDWQNSYAAFVTGLKRDLAAIEDEATRRKAIERMRDILASYTAHRTRARGSRRG
jgi:metallo-beta-lactamase family protein